MKEKVFPNDFCEYEANEIVFDDHSVCFEVESLSLVSEWTISVTANGVSKTDTVVQDHEDSAKYTFYDAYISLCKRLGVEPAKLS